MMNAIYNGTHEVFNIKTSVFSIDGEFFQDYPSVIKGYLFHFTFSDRIHTFDDPNFRFYIGDHWKYEINGSLEFLEHKLENLKNEFFKHGLLNINKDIYDAIDQFGYVNFFIIPKDEQYQLIVSSDTFDISKLIDLEPLSSQNLDLLIKE
jgi:hypothetical protein